MKRVANEAYGQAPFVPTETHVSTVTAKADLLGILSIQTTEGRLERFIASQKRRPALSLCFDAIPDGKPLHAFPAIALDVALDMTTADAIGDAINRIRPKLDSIDSSLL
ncbi:hypothetical protein ACFSOZ_22155 [Mesorhizobium newzealandense]|uniref:Uncharacterized protein n=1 Tax=Mesorhizobium newzealandense TaxID=1300302 RepID=A0ABW4UHW3_9HYPH